MKKAAGDGRDDKATPVGKGMRESSMRNLLWMSGGNGLSAILKLLVLAVLGRLLTPEDFGLVGAALTIVALAEVFGRIGIAPSIVQAPDLTLAMIKTGMVTTIAAGAIVAGLVYAFANRIAALYAIPELDRFIEVFSLLFVVRGVGLVSEALLLRRMQFRALAGIAVVTYLIGYAVVSVSMALMGFGAWALVAGQICQVVLQTAMFLRLAPDAIQFGFDYSKFRQMMRFGIGVTLSKTANYVAQNADYFIVGRYLGATNLGYYTRAYLLLSQPAQLVGGTANEVLFPAMSAVQSAPERLSRGLNLALKLCALIQVPATVLLIVTAPEVVAVLIGDQWDSVVLPFRILVASLYFRTAYKFLATLLRASGNVYYNSAWQWSYAALVIVGASLGVPWGLEGVALGVSLAVVLCFFSGLAVVRLILGISARTGMVALARYSGIGLVQLALLIILKAWLVALGLPDAAILLLLTLVCVLAFVSLLRIFPGFFGEEGELLTPYLNRVLARLRPGGGSGNGGN